MAINDSHPMKFTPRGLVDAFDATDKFPGACQALTNLIFDPSNPELVKSRPGVLTLVMFADGGFSNPGFISIQAVIGTRVYGMVATSRNAGHDEPFCYESATNSFIAISGVTALNTPTSPPTVGDWVPPTLTVVGVMVVITHAGFDGSANLLWGGGAIWGNPNQYWGTGVNFYGIIDLANPNAPAWRAENTAVNPLTNIPQAVANFNNRAYFAVGNQTEYTDVLTDPLTRTNATQALTVGDSTYINALNGLPVSTTNSGVFQTLTVFKPAQVWQIAGDTTTNNLTLNYVALNVGTNAPRSVVQAPLGLYFMSTGGPYFIDLLGTLRPLTYGLDNSDPDIQTPFENAITPTRWAGAYTPRVYRICGPTTIRGIQSTNDYWFDEHRRRWTGPHTFAFDCGSSFAGGFLLTSAVNPGQLITSAIQQNQSFSDADLGVVLQCRLLSSTFPKTNDMCMKMVDESQIELAASGGNAVYQITAQDDQGTTLVQCSIGVLDPNLDLAHEWGGGSLWGPAAVYTWGSGPLYGAPAVYWDTVAGTGVLWGAQVQSIPHTYPVPWPDPFVFEKMQLQITATASAEVAIGTFYARYQKTGYVTQG